LKRGLSTIGLDQIGHLEVDPNDPYGNILRIGSHLSDDGDDDKHEEEKNILEVIA
jgi:hypothetical protein